MTTKRTPTVMKGGRVVGLFTATDACWTLAQLLASAGS
jgi:hypothetical protein